MAASSAGPCAIMVGHVTLTHPTHDARSPSPHGPKAHPDRLSADRQAPSGALVRQPAEHAVAAGGVRRVLLRGRLACDDLALGRHLRDPKLHRGDGPGLGGRRTGPRQVHDLSPVRRSRGRRAGAVLHDGHADVVAGARALVQGAARADHRSRPGQRGLLPVSAAAGRRHHDRARGLRAGGRGPAAASGTHARDRAQVQQHLRRVPGRARGADSQGGRARPGHGRPQDVEELRQRHLHLRPARRDPRQGDGDADRPRAQAEDRPGRPRHLSAAADPQAGEPRCGRHRRVGRVLPQRRVRVRLAQEETDRGSDRLPRPRSRSAARSWPRARATRGRCSRAEPRARGR